MFHGYFVSLFYVTQNFCLLESDISSLQSLGLKYGGPEGQYTTAFQKT